MQLDVDRRQPSLENKMATRKQNGRQKTKWPPKTKLSITHSCQFWVFAGEYIWGVQGVQAKSGEYTGSTNQNLANLGSTRGVQAKSFIKQQKQL